MIRGFVRTVASVLAALAIQACSDGIGPDDFAGTYQLERFEGRTLPAVVTQSTFGTLFMISQRIVLGDNGKGVVVTTSRSVDDVTPQGADVTSSRVVGYVVRGSRVELTVVCPPDADCIAGPHYIGERVSGGLALGPPESSRPASIYKRVD
jgi:hypothetical protein